MSDNVEVYLASKYGQSPIWGQTGQSAAEYAVEAFAGVYTSREAYAAELFNSMSVGSQQDTLDEYGKDEADTEMFGWMADAMAVESNGVVEFVVTEAGVYVFDEGVL